MRSVLVIDDCDDFRSIVTSMLLDNDYDVREASCPDDAFAILRQETFDLIICDVHMPFTLGEHFHEYPYSFEVGIRTIQELGGVYPDRPIIAMSAADPMELKRIRKALGDLPLLSKPFPARQLLTAIEHSLQTQPSPMPQ